MSQPCLDCEAPLPEGAERCPQCGLDVAAADYVGRDVGPLRLEEVRGRRGATVRLGARERATGRWVEVEIDPDEVTVHDEGSPSPSRSRPSWRQALSDSGLATAVDGPEERPDELGDADDEPAAAEPDDPYDRPLTPAPRDSRLETQADPLPTPTPVPASGDTSTEVDAPDLARPDLEPTRYGDPTRYGTRSSARPATRVPTGDSTRFGGPAPDDADTTRWGAQDVPPGADVRIGQLLGTYRVVERLAVGGMGVVYRAWDTRLKRSVALKVRSVPLSDERAMSRFAGEARVLASLGHPNVVRIYDVGPDFHAMELLPGPTLSQWIRERAPDAASWERALAAPVEVLRQQVRWIRDASRAAHEAHEAGFVHRDLKPDNLMLDERGQIKVLDFGLAHVRGRELTRTQAQLGTPRYMAPEQITDPKSVDRRADVYALGTCLYALLSLGRPFHDTEEEHALLQRVARGDLVKLRRRNPHVPLDLDTIVSKALELRPQDRYPSAAALGADLDAWLDDRPISARPANLRERLVKFARREPNRARAWVALILALLALATLAGVSSRQAVALLEREAKLRAEKESAESHALLLGEETRQLRHLVADELERRALAAAERGAWNMSLALATAALVREPNDARRALLARAADALSLEVPTEPTLEWATEATGLRVEGLSLR